jgi:hypothetical protein
MSHTDTLRMHTDDVITSRSYMNSTVKTLDLSMDINARELPLSFCSYSTLKAVIFPSGIKIIQSLCFWSANIKNVDLSKCIHLTNIGSDFCSYSTVTNVIFPESVTMLRDSCFYATKDLLELDLRNCINLTDIGSSLCRCSKIKSIKFPKNLLYIGHTLCNGSFPELLDFSLCENLKINIKYIGSIDTLMLHNFDIIFDPKYTMQCKTIYIYNIKDVKTLDFSFITGLDSVYLPEGTYCILNKGCENVKFYLGNVEFSVEHFSELTFYRHVSIQDSILVDVTLDVI